MRFSAVRTEHFFVPCNKLCDWVILTDYVSASYRVFAGNRQDV